MDRKELMEVFNKRPRIGTLSTADDQGNVNVAVFGSPHMTDENTVVMGIGNNRTYRNLQLNPKAVFLIVEPGPTVPDWKGVRVYLEAVTVESKGPLFDRIKEEITNRVGKEAGQMIAAAVQFKITEVRPLLDRLS
ncbi:MAG: pyridoxamine 5'-phosphate oxidase family protein [Pseudomonadota bacterium]